MGLETKGPVIGETVVGVEGDGETDLPRRVLEGGLRLGPTLGRVRHARRGAPRPVRPRVLHGRRPGRVEGFAVGALTPSRPSRVVHVREP